MCTRNNRKKHTTSMPGQIGLDITPRPPADTTARFIDYLRSEPTPDEVAQELVLGYLSRCQARACVVSTIATDATLRLAGAFGLDPRSAARLGNASLWEALPGASAIRGQRSIVVSTPEMLTREFPTLVEVHSEPHSLVAVPLMTVTSTQGAICVCFKTHDPEHLSVAAQALKAISDIYALYLLTANRPDAVALPQRPAVGPMTETLSMDFSERQLSVLQLLADGMTYDQIAMRIGYSHSTVRMELMRMYRTFGVSSRREAVRVASQIGILARSGQS